LFELLHGDTSANISLSLKMFQNWLVGSWVAQSVKRLPSAGISGSWHGAPRIRLLAQQGVSLCPSLLLVPALPLALCSPSLSNNKIFKKKKKKKTGPVKIS